MTDFVCSYAAIHYPLENVYNRYFISVILF